MEGGRDGGGGWPTIKLWWKMFIRAHKAPRIAGLAGYKPLPNQPRHLAPGGPGLSI